jgi:hypothetical protein
MLFLVLKGSMLFLMLKALVVPEQACFPELVVGGADLHLVAVVDLHMNNTDLELELEGAVVEQP